MADRSAVDPRIAQFWKDVAGIHFTEDRSHRGDPLPVAALVTDSGERRTLASFGGKPILVNFWAHWCLPCRAEMPTFDRIAAERAAVRTTIAVNEDGIQPGSASLGELRTGPAIIRLSDPDLALAKSHAGGGLPTTILYGSDGRERWRLVGVLDWTGKQATQLLADAD